MSKCVQNTPPATKLGFPMYRVSNSLRSTHGRDGAVVLDVCQGQMFNLNLVGSRILELLMTGATESAIVGEISREFEVSKEIAERDAREFIGALKHHRLLDDLKSNDQR
jgi:hypothetical protein